MISENFTIAQTCVQARQVFIVDTNVIAIDDALVQRLDGDVIISFYVIEELDNLKTRSDDIGVNVRRFIRYLESLRKVGSLNAGVMMANGHMIRVQTVDNGSHSELTKKVDNQLVRLALTLKDSLDPVVVTYDLNLRLKCDAYNVKTLDVESISKASRSTYNGVTIRTFTDDEIQAFASGENVSVRGVNPNEFVIIKNEFGETIMPSRCFDGTNVEPLDERVEVFNLKPRNKEQNYALNLMLDPRVKLVTLMGKAGSGKTLISLAAGLQQLNFLKTKDSRYEKLVIMRSIQPMGRDVGFLPGTIEEKLEPWIRPIKDNLGFLISSSKRMKRDQSTSESFLDMMKDRGVIEVDALTYVRGRSISNAFIIIDEAQNLTKHELKTIVTRVGENTKIVLIGDVDQIDNKSVDSETNALSYAIEKFKGSHLAGHISLLRGERSELATLASEVL